MLFDKNKGIELITYNHLNLPIQIQFANGNNIDYFYNAVGQKVKKSVKTGEEYADTDYLSGFQYRSSYTSAQGDQSEATLQYFPHAEGYVQHIEGEFFYVYNYTDHLGNIRLSYTYDYANGLIKIMEENHYYPFGLKHDSYNTNRLGYSSYIDEEEISHIVLGDMPKFVGDGSYNYKYNGKELQDELGLNMYDYGARNYDPALGRWMNIDPLAEKYLEVSPYIYCLNNPIFFIDPDGKEVINGNKDRLNNAQNNFNEKKIKFNVKGNISKKEFKSNHTGKEWREFNNSKNELTSSIEAYNHTEGIIENFKTIDPVKFKILNELTYKNNFGEEVDLNVVVTTGSQSAVGGSTYIEGVDEHGSISKNSIFTVINFSSDLTSNVLSHEFGHVIDYSKDAQGTQSLVKNNPDHACQLSKNRFSKLSKTAMDWQYDYDKKLKEYRRLHPQYNPQLKKK